ncbi:MAG: RNA-binding protein [Pseudomonadales bacterium]|nr:RNA-binding protein [Candidatus Woesebacteria bacterium]MCB9802091.1 RNA-binding protein [Pseudomonadales bacterium]
MADTATQQVNPNKLFVGNIPWSITQDGLVDLFSQYGAIVDAKLMTERQTGRSKGFGFVEFESAEAAQAAIDALSGTEVEGRELVVNVARPRAPREDRGGYRGGGGGYNRDRNSRSW